MFYHADVVIRFKLRFMDAGFFKLSSFYRHLKEKQCVKLLDTVSTFYVDNAFYECFDI